jgi:hypothetical protein
MTLPRFTGGSVGRLTFRDLNEAFEIIDGVDRVSGTVGAQQMPRGRAVTAKVTGQQGANYSWYETVRINGAFVQYAEGRSSVSEGDQYAVPLIAYGSLTPSVGQDVVIFPIYDETGKLLYIPVAASAGGETFAAAVGSAPVALVPLQRWRYTLTEVSWNSSSSAWQTVQGGRVVQGYNGAENPIDSLNQPIGVGQGRGPTTSVERQPIKSPTVVQVSRDIGGQYFFCCPNGYTFTC